MTNVYQEGGLQMQRLLWCTKVVYRRKSRLAKKKKVNRRFSLYENYYVRSAGCW